MRFFLAVGMLFASIVAHAQDIGSTSLSAPDMDALQMELVAQREIIRQQQQEIHELKIQMTQVLAAESGSAKLSTAAFESRRSSDLEISDATSTMVNPQVPDQAMALRQQEKTGENKPSPLYFHIGGMALTPGGFLDFTSIFRSTNVGSGIGTSFGAIPLSNTISGQLTESRLSAQNSRLSLKVGGAAGKNDITGYVETDFGGFLPTNAFVTSNSDTLRLRLFWIDLRRNKWEFLAGESWSFLNPNRKGLSAMPSDIFFSQNMDTNYQVGLTWTRAPQFRLIYHPNEQWALGLAFENPEQYIGGSVVLPQSLASAYSSQLNNGSLTTTPNLHPDILPKIAFDLDIGGKHMHAELVGLVRSFKVFNPSTDTSSTVTGGGGSLNVNLEMVKNLHVILNSFYSDGGGRYIFGLGPDLIIRPDGTPSLVHSYSGIGGIEYQASPKTLISGYYGGAYFQHNFAFDPQSGTYVGYGFPGSSANRNIQEATVGVTETLLKDRKYGTLQLISQYSHVTRSLWSAGQGQPQNGNTHLVYVDFRYILP
jgi:hypothetical protein